MWRAFLQHPPDCIANYLRLPPQPRIPKPQHLYSTLFQIGVPFLIFHHLIRRTVLKTIQFNIEFRLQAEKIKDVWAVRMLPAEFILGKVPVPEPAPQKFFRPSVMLPQRAGNPRRSFGFGGIERPPGFHGMTIMIVSGKVKSLFD